MLEPLPQHRTLSIMPTYQCTAACLHCGTYSNPKEGTHLPEEVMLSAIDEAVSLGYKLIVFTGGEATLAGDKLLRGIQRAAEAGIFTRLVTNAWWASDERASDAKIAEFRNAGLHEINFSTGDQHARFVSLDNVMRATRSAARVKLSVCIMVEIVENRKISQETIEANAIYEETRQMYPRALIRILESPWMPLSPTKVNEYPPGIALNETNLSTKTGCNSCLGTTTLQADGRLAACCGMGMRRIPELQLGSAPSMTLATADATAGDDFLKRWIRVEGPEKILAWAATHDSSIEWQNMYGHKCQACIRIYKDEKVQSIIRAHHAEKIPDVFFAEWLLFHYRPEEQPATEFQNGQISNVVW